MGSITGIELGPDSCVLVSARRGLARRVEVFALHTIERAEWPSQEALLIEALREARRARKLPRRARVVAWGVREGSTLGDPDAAALLQPLRAAGFRVDALLSPPEALALVAAGRPRPSAVQPAVWAAVNVHGAAIAVVRGEELLFSRTLEWSYKAAVIGSRAQLLQRYSLVAQLAPEIRHAIATARLAPGETIGMVVMCGNLPELRSLTMPLIEELDLEVETLDSTDGLQAAGRAPRQRFVESAPALRLACAAALFTPPSTRSGAPKWLAAAAALALIAALGWGMRAYRGSPPAPASGTDSRRSTAAPVTPRTNAGVEGAPVGQPGPAAATRTAAAPLEQESRRPPTAVFPSPAQGTGSLLGSRPTAPSVDSQAAGRQPAPISTTGHSPAAAPKAAQSSADGRRRVDDPDAAHQGVAPRPVPGPVRSGVPPIPAAGTPTRVGPAAVATAPSKSGQAAVPSVKRTTAPTASADSASIPRVLPGAGAVRHAPAADGRVQAPRRATRKGPAQDPLPRLDSILVDQDRRLAIVAGAVVRVGDTVGSRTVVQIERDAVILREPSGASVRVPLRAKSG